MKQMLRRMIPMIMMLAMLVGFFPATEIAHASDENPMRAIWLRPKETTKDQVEEHVQQIKDAGLNTIFLETVFNGYTIFPVEYDATYQNPDYDDFDVLQAYIDACHSRGMQLHCWVESFFIGMQREDGGGPVMRAHKDWLLTDREGNNWEDTMYGKMYFLNPARPECREWIVGLYEILCTNYDLDGIQLDYVRYPQKTKEKDYGYDDFTINAFVAEKGYDPRDFKSKSFEVKTFEYYKQQQVTEFVRMCSTRLRAIKPELILSLSVYPFFDDGREQFMQSAREWMEKGYGDLVVPMAYYENAVASLTKDAIKLAGSKGNAVIGVSAQNGFSTESLKTQMEEVLKQGAGVAVFEFESYFANYAAELNGTVLTDTVYDLDPAVYVTKVERVAETPTPVPTLAPEAENEEIPQVVPEAQYSPATWILAGVILVAGCGLIILFVALALRTPKKEKK